MVLRSIMNVQSTPTTLRFFSSAVKVSVRKLPRPDSPPWYLPFSSFW